MPDSDRYDRRSFLALTGIGMAGTISGCLGGEDPQSDEDGENGGNGEITVVAGKPLQSLDPHQVSDDLTKAVSLLGYSGLLTVSPDGEIVESLATNWEAQDEAATTWEVTLREDVVSHHGNELTAEDVVYSADRWASLNIGYSSIWAGVYEPGSAEAIDDYTVVFDLEQPFGPFPASLTMFKIVDSEVVAENEEGDDYGEDFLSGNTAGFGPYELVEDQGIDGLVFEAHDDYWQGWDDDQFTTVRQEFVDEEATIRQMMTGGDAHMTDQYLSPDAYNELRDSDETYVVSEPGTQLFELPMNTRIAPLDDIDVRRACALAFDYETIQTEVFNDAVSAAGPVPQAMIGHNDDLEPVEQDFDAAQDALNASGYSLDEINDAELEIVWLTEAEYTRQVALSFAEALGEIGIDSAEINGITFASWAERVASPEETPHFTTFNHSADFATPDNFLFQKFHPSNDGSIVSASWYRDEELTRVLEESRSAGEESERMQKYREAQELIHEAYPCIFAASPPYELGISNEVTNWSYHGGILGYPRQVYPLRQDN